MGRGEGHKLVGGRSRAAEGCGGRDVGVKVMAARGCADDLLRRSAMVGGP